MPEAQAAIKAGCHTRRAARRGRDICDGVLVAAVHSHTLCRAFAALLVNMHNLTLGSRNSCTLDHINRRHNIACCAAQELAD